MRALAESRGVKAAALIHATRVAVTGRAVSPGLFEVLELMGRERVTLRLRRGAEFPPEVISDSFSATTMQLPTVPLLSKIFPIYGKARGAALKPCTPSRRRRHRIAVIG